MVRIKDPEHKLYSQINILDQTRKPGRNCLDKNSPFVKWLAKKLDDYTLEALTGMDGIKDKETKTNPKGEKESTIRPLAK